MFCTNGVLLRMLTSGDSLAGVTHVICDEIHERDKFADFLVILLRELLPRRPDLRVVLMSATLHSALFAAYFGGCPVVSVTILQPSSQFVPVRTWTSQNAAIRQGLRSREADNSKHWSSRRISPFDARCLA